MEVKKVKVTAVYGLHMRESAKVAQIAKQYKSKVLLCHGCKFADTCSILETAKKDGEVAIIAEGPDEKEAVENICELFRDK